jgi:hypothetical protein
VEEVRLAIVSGLTPIEILGAMLGRRSMFEKEIIFFSHLRPIL